MKGVEVARDLRFVLPVDGAQPEPESSLPPLDVSGLPGAVVALRRGWIFEDATTLRAACVRATTARWAPGLEAVIFDRATGLARASLGSAVTTWTPHPATTRPDGTFEQNVEALVNARPAYATHLLAFTDTGQAAVLCTATCIAPPLGPDPCPTRLAAAHFEGTLNPPPAPHLWLQTLLTAAAHPLATALAAALVILAAATLTLRHRPRPRHW